MLELLTQIPFVPPCIHKLQLQLTVNPEAYVNFAVLFENNKNKPMIHIERIGKPKGSPNVKYIVYPKGKIMIYVACSENPFKMETDT